MLCPQCGAPVGEVVSLCANCQALAPQTEKDPLDRNSGQPQTTLSERDLSRQRGDDREKLDRASLPSLGDQPERNVEVEAELDALATDDLASPFSRILASLFDFALLTALFHLTVYPLLQRGIAETGRNFVMKKAALLKLHEFRSTLPFALEDLIYQTVVALLFVSALLVVAWLYSSVLESLLGGTLGKVLLGMQVQTPSGARVSFLRSSFRFFAKFAWLLPLATILVLISGLSGTELRSGSATFTVFRVLLALGYFITPLLALLWFLASVITPGKQAIHDLFSDTVVRRSQTSPTRLLVCLGLIVSFAGYFIWSVVSSAGSQAQLTPASEAPAAVGDAITSRTELDAYLKRKEEERMKEAEAATAAIPLSSDEQAELQKKLEELSTELLGFVASGAERIRFRTAVAVYSPNTRKVIVALYSKKLDAAERATALKELSGKTKVTRAPSAVVDFDLKDPKLDIVVTNIARYSVRFYREFGVFSFAGFEPSVSFERESDAFKLQELQTLAGRLDTRPSIRAVMVGKGRGANGADFEWGLKFELTIE